MTTKVTGSVLADTAVTAGNYGGASTLQTVTVDAQGRITYAANLTSGVITAGTIGQAADIIVPTIRYNALGQIVAATNNTIRIANTVVTGVVQLADSVSNTSTTAAATASAVKAAFDAAGTNAASALTSAQANTGAGLIAERLDRNANVGAVTIIQNNLYTAQNQNINNTTNAFNQANLAFSTANSAFNASNLSSGTVPSARISGSYTGITGVGTLTTGSIPGTLISSAVSSATNATNATNVSGTGTVTVANLATAAKPVGAGQTWQDVSTSRTNNTSYTNNTGRPIQVSVYAYFYSGQYMELQIDSISVALAGSSGGTTYVGGTVSGIVPAGSTYQIVATAVSVVQKWSELR